MNVTRYGTDSSGRPIFATPLAAARLDGLIHACQNAAKRSGGNVPNFTPTIVQGAFMSRVSGGGAKASAGYHDQAGCYDFRVWNLSESQRGFLIREARRRAVAMWVRDKTHGNMDPHAHGVICDDAPLASGAAFQVRDYRSEGSGLSGAPRHDYHWRPTPLVTAYNDAPAVRRRTPNITAALATRNTQARKAALRRVIANGGGTSKAALTAQRWLDAILTAEAAQKRLTATGAAARRDLRSLEAA